MRRRLTGCVLVAVAAGALAMSGLSSAGAAASSEEGVTNNSVKIGYIFSQTGVAGSTFQNADKGCKARIDRQNAAGGVNGRKIDVIYSDDQSANNLTVAQDLVQNKHVFAIMNNSSFAFSTYRWLQDHNIPQIGGGYDGTYYGDPGNQNIISALGNVFPQNGVTGDGIPKIMKAMGAHKVAALAYGVSPSSTAAAQSLIKYAVPATGLKKGYLNTTVDFGSTDVGPYVLGIKNDGADAVYLPLVANSNIAVAQQLAQNGVKMKSIVMATGYGQPLLDQPASKSFTPNIVMATGWAPVELKTKATEQFQADLKKYTGYTGVPDFGIYTGYIDCDLVVLGLQHAGNPPTRQGFIDGLHTLGHFNPGGGLGCQDVDISLKDYGKAAPTGCSWYVQVKNGKFVVFKQKNGQSIWTSKLIAASTAATTTTTAPAS
ncbi:MAG TPA: ABC transporter substrate-binding protein [Acidimicrobiia bacterium]|nr:ABC transporter substrate-binding protein [Acidimicrobiia bacterium]